MVHSDMSDSNQAPRTVLPLPTLDGLKKVNCIQLQTNRAGKNGGEKQHLKGSPLEKSKAKCTQAFEKKRE